jgi:lipopolysaccharide transport system ATP-binding protein
MSPPVISVENLGKKYRIHHQQERQRYVALRDVLADKARSAVRGPLSVVRRLWGEGRRKREDSRLNCAAMSPLPSPLSPLPRSEDFWALKDVSFEVRQGEVIGIIGRNGAGKSTLLKILSRITEPTEGRVRIRGRVASLLEVGTGFHPELTGRENIFLNGAILGMTRAEIRRRFDEIVAFAETEKFLDTPVKRYSSGMYVRLAFAVAAHLEPEILIVDEVLAVGDAQFQQKCLGKMSGVARAGRTVLLVSHTMPAIQKLCSRVVLLCAGTIASAGDPMSVTAAYLEVRSQFNRGTIAERIDREGSGEAKVINFRVNGIEAERHSLCCGARVAFAISYRCDKWFSDTALHLAIYNRLGDKVAHLSTRPGTLSRPVAREGTLTAVCEVPWLSLTPGEYVLNLGIVGDGRQLDRIESATAVSVQAADAFGTGWMGPADSMALSLMQHRWSVGLASSTPQDGPKAAMHC